MLNSITILTVHFTVRTLRQRVVVQRPLALETFETFLVIVAILARHLLRLKHLAITLNRVERDPNVRRD